MGARDFLTQARAGAPYDLAALEEVMTALEALEDRCVAEERAAQRQRRAESDVGLSQNMVDVLNAASGAVRHVRAAIGEVKELVRVLQEQRVVALSALAESVTLAESPASGAGGGR